MKFLPKRLQTKRFVYLGAALVLLFSTLSYINKAPLAQAATVGTSSTNTAVSTPEQRKIVQSTNGTFITVYNAGTESPSGLAYRTSTDNGGTWSSGIQIDSAATSDFSIAIDASDNIYVAFSDSGTLKSRKLTYSGGSWSVNSAVTIITPTACVVSATNGVQHISPTIAIDGSGKAWINSVRKSIGSFDCTGLQYGILETFQSTDGATWTKNASDLYTYLYSDRPNPIVSTGKDLWMLSPSESSNYMEMYIDRGATGLWTKIAESSSLDRGNETSISYGLDEIHILSRYAANDIRYQKFSLTNYTFSSITTISSDPNDRLGSITTDSYNVWAIYRDDVGANSYNIVYKRFNGTSWDGSFTAITTDNATNIAPTVPHRLRNTANLPVIWNSGTSSPYTIKSSVFSSLGTATDSGTLSGSYTGSLTGNSGDQLVKSGEWYYNSVNIVNGMTVRIVASDGVIGGSLILRSNTVTIAGTLDGSGRGLAGGFGLGNPGGAGGGGGSEASGGAAGEVSVLSYSGSAGGGTFGGSVGTSGTNSSSGGYGGAGGAFQGGYGGGGGGGSISTGNNGGIGGYASSGSNGDSSTNETLVISSGGGAGGSGGAGAGGGGGGAGLAIGAAGGSGGAGAVGGFGGKGGNAGALVKIYSSGSISITGTISLAGQTGASGGAANPGSNGGQGAYPCLAC